MDIETYEENNNVIPYLFVLTDGTEFLNFYLNDNDITSLFLNQVEKKTRELGLEKIDVYAHNINFDGYILIEYFLKKNIPYKWFIRELNLYFIEFSYKGTIIRIRCSYKLLGLSVEDLGKILSAEDNNTVLKKIFPHKFLSKSNLNYVGEVPSRDYFENEKDYQDFKKKWKNNINIKSLAIGYAYTDIKIVWLSLKKLFKMSNAKLLANSFSFSSYSYKLFIKKYDIHKIGKIKLRFDEKTYVEDAYFGGRTEIFGNTKNGIIHRFDFPGMYGNRMKEKFPIGKPKFVKPVDFDKPGFYTVSVESNLKYPVLPIRAASGKIIYPNGKFVTRLTRDEFLFFIEKGGKISKIHSAMVYENEDYVFSKFINDFEQVKKQGEFHKMYGKAVINSLYGSFALKKDKIKYTILHDLNELFFLIEEGRIKNFTIHKNIVIAGINNDVCVHEREDRNTAYAAFISAKARIVLHKNVYALDEYYTKKYGDFYKLLYLETDSIDVSLPENCLNETVEDVTWQKIYNKGVYISPKFYLFENEKPKIKGVRHTIFDYKKIHDAFYNDNDNSKLLFTKQLQFSKKNFKLIQSYIDKNLKISSYDKRIFSQDKLTTEAVIINEESQTIGVKK